MRDRSRPPFWETPRRGGDHVHASIEEFVETPEDARYYQQIHLKTLMKCDGAEELVSAIERCSDPKPCRLILCPICARQYRIWFSRNALTWIRRAQEQSLTTRTLTVRLEQASDRALHKASIRRIHAMLRKRLTRANISRVIGGTEASFNPVDGMWTVHVHLLIIAASRLKIDNFRRSCASDGIPRSVDQPRDVADPLQQITYLQKFSTYYRAGGRPFPLKTPQMRALARWTEQYNFEDFLFLAGFRRNGNRIDLVQLGSGLID